MRYGSSLVLRSFTVSLESGVWLRILGSGVLEFGDLVHISRNSNVESHEEGRVKIGDRVFINKNCTIVARSGVTIGDDCLIGENVSIYDHDHKFSAIGLPIKDQGYRVGATSIGNRVWIGSSVFIGRGVSVGDDVVIGAHSVITKNIPNNSVIVSEVQLRVKSRESIADT